MILVAHEKGSKELAPIIRQLGVQAEVTQLPYGDFAFDGKGKDGPVSVGIERKTLHDMLMCIDDGRFSGHQRIGMEELYSAKYLAMEGIWKAHEKGFLMEGNSNGQFWICKPGGRTVMYAKLKRFLISVANSGVTVTQSRDMFQTAYDICEIYHWWQTPWHMHKSMQQIQTPRIACLIGKPSVKQMWAHVLPGVDDVISERAAQRFKLPIDLAIADKDEWLSIPGIGAKKVAQIIKEIRG